MSSQGGDYGIHFFKVILESNLSDGELRMPKSFVKKYWHEVSNPVFLRLPNSTKWKVYWMKRDGDVWFRNGWTEFASYLSLDVAQFLVFEFEEKSLFKVIVLGENGSEIKYPPLKEGEAVYESDCSVEIIDDFSPLEGKRLKFSSPYSRTRKKMKSNPKEEPECYSNHAETKHEKKKFHAGFVPKNSGDLKLVDDESKALLEDVKKSFSSENHFFLCRCQKTYAERDLMNIPKDFWDHLQNKEGKATLLVNQERTWDVKIKISSHRQLSFCEGWKKFFQDNNLKFGDVCAFVLDKCNGFSFIVHIFRLGEDSSKDQEGLSHRPSSFPRNLETPKANSRCMLKNEFTHYFRHSTPLSSANIPIDFIRNCNSHDGKYATLQFEKRPWRVKVLHYPQHSSAKFSIGWLDFVTDCNLKKGDACRFKLIDEENLVIKVSITRGNQ